MPVPARASILRATVDAYATGLPGDILDHAELLVYNGLAAAAVGMRHPILISMIEKAPGVKGGMTPPWSDRSTTTADAASVLAAAISVDAFDDYDVSTLIHPTTASLGAVLPMAAALGVAGRDALTAFVLGCEVALRVGDALQPSHFCARMAHHCDDGIYRCCDRRWSADRSRRVWLVLLLEVCSWASWWIADVPYVRRSGD